MRPGAMGAATPAQTVKNATMGTTLDAMRRLAQQGKTDLVVRDLVEEITAGLAQGDYAGEALAIYYWVCQNIRYMRDIDKVEFLKTPRKTIETRSGDCDDMATLLAAMLMAAGNPVQFAVASFKNPPVFSHVYVELITPNGVVTIDPVANRDTHKMIREMKHKGTFPVSGGGSTMDAGIGGAPHVGNDGGTLYSTYDYHRGVYEYFEAPSKELPATGRYRAPMGGVSTSFGMTPESIAAPLPSGSVKVGEGDVPKGVVAAKKSAPLLSLALPSKQTLFAVAFGVGIGWWLWRRRAA